MKVLIFVEHDVIIRHFLHSHVFAPLIERHEVVFVFPEKGHKRVKIDLDTVDFHGATVRHLQVSQERLRRWQHLFFVDMLQRRPGPHFAAMRRFYKHTIGTKAGRLFSILALPGLRDVFRAWSHWRIRSTPYHDLDRLLDEERPDVILHPSVLAGVFINDLIDRAASKRIPLIVIMNSWDNPSTKRAVTGQPDWLLVWGPQTNRHATWFMGMPADRVVNFGSAQFDLYRHPPRISRDEFCRRHAIDPAAKILLYAGSSKGTDEFSHLRELDDWIERGDLGHTVVVYRPHPWGEGGRGGARILQHPWRHIRIEETMRGYLEQVMAGSAGMSTPDYRITHDLLSSVDAVVSPLSTILIEGALHGKPVLCFLPDDEAEHMSLALPMTHFDDLFDRPSFLVARGNREFAGAVKTLLSRVGDAEVAAQLRATCDHFVTSFDRPYGERLVEFVEQAAGAR